MEEVASTVVANDRAVDTRTVPVTSI